MQSLRGHARVLPLALLLACGTDAPVEPGEMAPGTVSANACVFQTVNRFTRRWGCNAIIKVRSDPSNSSTFIPTVKSAVEGAAAAWNLALPASGAPRFAYAGPGAAFNVSVKLTSGSGDFCGDTDPTTGALVTIYSVNGSKGCASNWADLTTTLVHEFGHVIGFGKNEEQLHSNGVSVHCAMHLPNDNSINESVCQHEVERIYAAYGIIPVGEVNSNTFYQRHVVTGVNTPSSLSLTKGQTKTLGATQLTFARGLTGATALGSTKLNWSSDAEQVATVGLTTGLVTGMDGGTTKVRARVTASTLPSTYLQGGLLGKQGQETAVTVTVPPYVPPGPGFRITDITGVAEPIDEAGGYTFGVQVYNGDSPSSLTVKWTFSASNGAFAPFTTQWVARNYTLNVPPGSYEIRVTAQPRNQVPSGGYIVGGSYIEDFTVCTGSGGGGGDPLLRAKGGVWANALPGC